MICGHRLTYGHVTRALRPIYSPLGDLLGVAAADIDMSELSQELSAQQLESSCESRLYMTENNGEVLVNGNHETYVVYGTGENASTLTPFMLLILCSSIEVELWGDR